MPLPGDVSALSPQGPSGDVVVFQAIGTVGLSSKLDVEEFARDYPALKQALLDVSRKPHIVRGRLPVRTEPEEARNHSVAETGTYSTLYDCQKPVDSGD